MLYVLIGDDAPDSLEKRTVARPRHIERLKALAAEGRLLVAGPMPAVDSSDPGAAGFTGSVIIAEFDSLYDAETWAADDPYVAAGVYDRFRVRPYIKVLP